MLECSKCPTYVCRVGDTEHGPENCPMLGDFPTTGELYSDPQIRRVARVAAQVVGAGYGQWTRVEEIIEFARRLDIAKLGLAFCAALRKEAKILTDVLEANGFEVVSVMCKTGGVPKEEVGVLDSEKVKPGTLEVMCNPIAQARLLNRNQTGLNIILGLCLGHDSLFIKHSQALVTCLVVKDRVLSHNPVAALYQAEGAFREALYQAHKKPA